MLKLKILKSIFEQMLRQAKAEAPVEACGILAGKDSTAEKLYKMTNVDNSSDHFMMEPKEQFAVVKDVRESGLKILAIYHSHPNTPARPSAEDIRLALTQDVVHVIVSLQNSNRRTVRGFIIKNGNVAEVLIRIVER